MNDNEAYHADTSRVSKSGLDLINKAPALYYHRYFGVKNKRKSVEALLFGTGFHTFILEPEKIETDLAVEPLFRGVGSQAKKTDWRDMNSDKTIITKEQHIHILGMRTAIQSHPIASKLLENGVSEEEFNWIDKLTGVKCKCRTDFRTSNGYILDLKSAKDASNYGFQKQARQHRYHVQDAFYSDGVSDSGETVKGFIFIAVEKEPPYLVNVFKYNDYERDLARDIYRQDLRVYNECKETDSWPGYEEKIHELTVEY